MRREAVGGIYRLQNPCLAGAVVAVLGLVMPAAAQTPAPTPSPTVLARDAAIQIALRDNPTLRTVRNQRGFAEAAVVIAKTYPFNPIFTGYVTGVTGPYYASVSNFVYQEHYISLELEVCGQGGHRRAAAEASASRSEWEICQQELAVSITVIKAYNAVLYRTKKLEFLEELIRTNEGGVEQLRKQAEAVNEKA